VREAFIWFVSMVCINGLYQGIALLIAENPHLSEIGKGTSSTRDVKSSKFNAASAAEVRFL
jgi:hypothetical protein